MNIYIRRVQQFDARQYLPSEPGFDIQGYIDWIMSFTGQASTFPVNAVHNTEDNSLTISWQENGGDYSWDEPMLEGMYGMSQVIPVISEPGFTVVAEDWFNTYFQTKP